MKEGEKEKHWTEELFVEKGELFLKVVESQQMLTRGEEEAKALADYLRSKGVKAGKLLEVGCGNGRVLIPLVKEGYQAVGVDISPLLIERAKERAEREGVKDRATFLLGDARRLNEVSKGYGPFDVILFVWTTILGYYDEETDLAILSQCREVSKPETLLMIAGTASQTLMAFVHTYFRQPALFTDYGDFVVVDSPSYDAVTSKVTTKWIFYRREGNDLKYIDQVAFSLRVYALHELVEIARRAGWCLVEALYSFRGPEPHKPVGPLNAVFRLCEQA